MVSRRLILAGATGIAAGAVPLTGAFADEQPERAIPRTLARPRRLAAGAHTAEAQFPVTHLGVSWQGPSAGLRLRTRAGWGDWTTLGGCSGAPDGRTPAPGALLVADGVIGYEIAVAGGGPASVVELNTVDGPTRTYAPAPAARMRLGRGWARMRHLSRAAWGADETLRFGADGVEKWPPVYYPAQTITVHHTATRNDDPNPAATMRAIYYDQAILREFDDFGYHVMIDEAGRVYEGRWSGDDGVPIFGTLDGDGPLRPVNAAHVGGFNAGNIGVCLMGNFTDRQPTPAARRTLTFVLAHLAKACALNPLGKTNYVNPVNAATRTVNTIPGHREWAETQCPGNAFYPQLPGLRQDVADLMRMGIAYPV